MIKAKIKVSVEKIESFLVILKWKIIYELIV